MPLLSFLLQFACWVSLALASYLSACSSNSVTPCSCPAGTTYQESATFAVIGAAGTDVRDLVASFFKTSWFGALPYATNGIDFQPGATRSYKFPTSIGVYDITEELTYFQSCSSGSFIWKLEQAPNHVQIEYHTHNGSFSGYWATMRSDAVFQNETAIAWSVYENATGHPLNYAPFQAGALNNAIKILTSEGKVRGKSIKPVSIQNF